MTLLEVRHTYLSWLHNHQYMDLIMQLLLENLFRFLCLVDLQVDGQYFQICKLDAPLQHSFQIKKKEVDCTLILQTFFTI